MKKLNALLLAILLGGASFGQTTIYSESFEDTVGWAISHLFDDGFEDYILHDSVAKINARNSGPDFTIHGADSAYVIAMEDINSGDAGSVSSGGNVEISIDSIPITGYDSLRVWLSAAANPTSNRYDNALNSFGNGDSMSVWASIDGGAYSRVLFFCAPDSNAAKTSTSNTGSLYYDSNMNFIGGDANDVAIDDTLESFSSMLSTVGNFLSIKIRVRTESGDEEIVIDNFRVQGVLSTTCRVPSGMMINQTSPTSVSLSWTSLSGMSDIEWDTTGFTQGTGNMINNVTSSQTVNGLVSGGVYQFYYRDSCTSIGKSNWVGPVTFTMRSAPEVTDIWRTSSTTIMVAYTDSMDNTSATSAARYKGITGLSSVSLNAAQDTATLTYSSAFANGVQNVLTVDSVMNTNNIMLDTHYTYRFVYNNSQPSLVINEIMYNDLSGPDTLEYIEILNNGTSAATLGGLSFGQGVTHEFAAGTTLGAGAYMILARDSADFNAVFGSPSVQWMGGGLSNSGEDILIWNSEMDTIDYVNYDDANGWPTDPDGGGYSLVLCDPNSDNTMASSWGVEPTKFGSTDYYVSPRAANTCRPPFVPPLYSISSLKTYDADGDLDSNGVKCAIEGIVVTDNMSTAGASGPDVSFVIVDLNNSAGFTAVSFSDTSVIGYTPHLGDSIKIYGEVSQFRGLGQFEIDSVTRYAQNVIIPAPYVTDTLGEITESRFIKLSGLTVIDPLQWPSTGQDRNVDVLNSQGDTLTMRIDQHTDVAANWSSAPSGAFDLMGVGGQFDGSSPYLSGYQVFPRFYTDIDTNTVAPCLPSSNLSVSNPTTTTLDVSWTAGAGTAWTVLWAKGSTGGPTDSATMVTANPYTITGLDPNSSYRVWLKDECTTGKSVAIGPQTGMTTPTCNGSSNLAANKITENSAEISWTAGDGGSFRVGWAIGHMSTAPSDSSISVITASPFNLTGLNAGTHYHVWVKDVCGGGRTSAWEGPVMFNTADAVGVSEVSSGNSPLRAWPNPNNTGMVKLSRSIDFTLTNVVGQPVITGQSSDQIDVSGLESGMYILHSEDGDTLRLIIE